MKKALTLAVFSFITCCLRMPFAAFGAEACPLQKNHIFPKILPVVGLQFDEKSGEVPYSFYYPYTFGYYYPETYGYSTNSGTEEECYTHFENGTFFYQCD